MKITFSIFMYLLSSKTHKIRLIQPLFWLLFFIFHLYLFVDKLKQQSIYMLLTFILVYTILYKSYTKYYLHLNHISLSI